MDLSSDAAALPTLSPGSQQLPPAAENAHDASILNPKSRRASDGVSAAVRAHMDLGEAKSDPGSDDDDVDDDDSTSSEEVQKPVKRSRGGKPKKAPKASGHGDASARGRTTPADREVVLKYIISANRITKVGHVVDVTVLKAYTFMHQVASEPENDEEEDVSPMFREYVDKMKFPKTKPSDGDYGRFRDALRRALDHFVKKHSKQTVKDQHDSVVNSKQNKPTDSGVFGSVIDEACAAITNKRRKDESGNDAAAKYGSAKKKAQLLLDDVTKTRPALERAQIELDIIQDQADGDEAAKDAGQKQPKYYNEAARRLGKAERMVTDAAAAESYPEQKKRQPRSVTPPAEAPIFGLIERIVEMSEKRNAESQGGVMQELRAEMRQEREEQRKEFMQLMRAEREQQQSFMIAVLNAVKGSPKKATSTISLE